MYLKLIEKCMGEAQSLNYSGLGPEKSSSKIHGKKLFFLICFINLYF